MINSIVSSQAGSTAECPQTHQHPLGGEGVILEKGTRETQSKKYKKHPVKR